MGRRLIGCLVLALLGVTGSAQHPVIGGYNVYYGDLHNHSNVSDGTGTPASAYNYARNTAHLDFFNLSDHANFITPTEWADIKAQADIYNQDGVFASLHGFEWSPDGTYGHINVINTDDLCSLDSPTDTFEGLVVWLASRPSGIAFFNHPGVENKTGLEFNHFTTTPSDQLVGIELWNRGDGFSNYYYNDGYYTGDNNKSYIDEANNRGWKVGASGGGDNHFGTWGTAYPFRTAVLADNLTRADILEAMKARRFFSTLDKNLSLSFKINGMEMGSTMVGNNYSAQIQATDGDGEVFNQVILYDNNHDIVNTWTPNTSNVDVSMNLTTTDGQYYYVKVREADGNEAISSPIWISGVSLNKNPLCTITSPSNGATYTRPANITINANAVDTDGSIAKVEFYEGTTRLGEDLTAPYSFAWNNVGSGTYRLTIKAIDDLDAVATSTAVTITVTARPITVTADNKTKVYGGSDPALTYRITSGSLMGEDTFTGSLTRDAGENTGSHTIRRGTLALNSNYTLTFVEADLEITPRPVTITANDRTKVYGNPDPVLTYQITSGSLTGSDSFSGTLTRDQGENVDSYAIRQGTLTINNNYTLSFIGADLTITTRPVTVTAGSLSKLYADPDPLLSYQITSGSLAASDSFSGSLTRDPGENIGSYTISQGTLSLNSNYILTFIGANLMITTRPVTVSASPVSKIYGNTDPALTYQVTSGSLAGSDTFSGHLAREAGESAGTYTITRGTLDLNSHYILTFEEADFTINRRPVTVTADPKTRVYGDPYTLTYRITSGSLAGTDLISGELVCAPGEDVGVYAISRGTLSISSNYSLTFIGANLVIIARPVTVSADPVVKIYGESDPELTYRITSGNLAGNGDAFTGKLSRQAGEDVGEYPISQGTLYINSNYDLTFIGDTFTIEKQKVVIAADPQSKIYGDTDPELTFLIVSGNNSGLDSLKGELSREPGENAGNYMITTGTLEVSRNFMIELIPSYIEIKQRAVTVAADTRKKVYWEPDPELTYRIISGELIGTDTFSGSLIRQQGDEIGAYPITVGSLSLGDNYNMTFVGAEFIITATFEMKVYPNPFTDHISFELELNYKSTISIDIFDLQGRKIATVFRGNAEPDYYHFDYLPENLTGGVYIYQLTIGGTVVVKGKAVHLK